MKTVIAMLLLTNFARAAAGVPALHEDKYLDGVAQARADYLCQTTVFSHQGWDSKQFWGEYYLRYDFIGENLAKGFPDASSTQAAFLASPTHKANIVNKRFTNVGFGAACNVIVEEFGGTD